MSNKRNIVHVEVTTLVRFAPDEERERLSLHFKGKSLKRLLSMVDDMEAGKFYEAAKTYHKECSREEKEAVGMGMTAIIDGIADREVNKKSWAERTPGAKHVETYSGVIDGSALEYPRYALASTAPSAQQTVEAVLGDSPSP